MKTCQRCKKQFDPTTGLHYIRTYKYLKQDTVVMCNDCCVNFAITVLALDIVSLTTVKHFIERRTDLMQSDD